MGKGSNSLILDSALTIPFIKLGKAFQSIAYQNGYVYAKAGTSVPQLMAFSQKEGLSGLEFMSGVPASLGGMIAMNFGCWDRCMKDIVESVDVFIPKKGFVTFTNEECNFDYRSSLFQSLNGLIIGAKLAISHSNSKAVKETINRYVSERLQKQPMRLATFGSIFKNPPSSSAALLIDRAGLKGYQYPRVRISTAHANFMENKGKASSKEALDLIQHIQQDIYNRYNVTLIPEVHIFQ